MSKNHPTWEAILHFVEGRESAPDLTEHLADCPACAERVDRARAVLALLGEARLPDPPESLLARTREILRKEPTPLAVFSQRVGRILREIWARPHGDSLRPNLALRGPGENETRTQLFEAEGYSVAVMSAPTGDGLRLHGQVTPPADAELPAGALAYFGGVEETLDDLGEFHIETSATEIFELAIVLEDLLIRLRLQH